MADSREIRGCRNCETSILVHFQSFQSKNVNETYTNFVSIRAPLFQFCLFIFLFLQQVPKLQYNYDSPFQQLSCQAILQILENKMYMYIKFVIFHPQFKAYYFIYKNDNPCRYGRSLKLKLLHFGCQILGCYDFQKSKIL